MGIRALPRSLEVRVHAIVRQACVQCADRIPVRVGMAEAVS